MPERGVEELLQVGETARLVPYDNPSGMPWRSWAAEGLRRLGRNEEARALAEEELAPRSTVGAPQAIGVPARARSSRGRRGGNRAAPGGGRAARGPGSSAEHVRALVDLGAALRREETSGRRRERLREGVDLARTVGALGLPSGRTTRSPPPVRDRERSSRPADALTASERRVRAGTMMLLNKEIAQRSSSRSRRSRCLSHAYRKLEISPHAARHGPADSRTEPGARA